MKSGDDFRWESEEIKCFFYEKTERVLLSISKSELTQSGLHIRTQAPKVRADLW